MSQEMARGLRQDMPAGCFPVGYRGYLEWDPGRAYGPPGTTRPLLVALWYPARAQKSADGDALAMRREDYLRLEPGEGHGARAFALRLAQDTRERIGRTVLGTPPGEWGAPERDALERFWQEPVPALRDATPALPSVGDFPLVVTHPGFGGTFLDSAPLCEFLASQGYRVLASAYQPQDPSSLHVGQDTALSLRDMTFLAQKLGGGPAVEGAGAAGARTPDVGALGHSYGAQAALAWAAQPGSPVRAAVSLDATLEYVPLEEEEVWSGNHVRVNVSLREVRTRFDAARAHFTTPLLVFTQARLSPGYGLYDRLARSERYYAEVAGVNHLDFGALYTLTRDLRPPDAPAAEFARAAYGALSRLTCRFLDAFLKGDAAAQAGLRAAADPALIRLIRRPAAD